MRLQLNGLDELGRVLFPICNHDSSNIEHSWTYSAKLGITQNLRSAAPSHSDIQGQGGLHRDLFSVQILCLFSCNKHSQRQNLEQVLNHSLKSAIGKKTSLTFNKLTDIPRMCRHLVSCWLSFPDPNMKNKIKNMGSDQTTELWVRLHDNSKSLSN